MLISVDRECEYMKKIKIARRKKHVREYTFSSQLSVTVREMLVHFNPFIADPVTALHFATLV